MPRSWWLVAVYVDYKRTDKSVWFGPNRNKYNGQNGKKLTLIFNETEVALVPPLRIHCTQLYQFYQFSSTLLHYWIPLKSVDRPVWSIVFRLQLRQWRPILELVRVRNSYARWNYSRSSVSSNRFTKLCQLMFFRIISWVWTIWSGYNLWLHLTFLEILRRPSIPFTQQYEIQLTHHFQFHQLSKLLWGTIFRWIQMSPETSTKLYIILKSSRECYLCKLCAACLQ